MRKGFVGFSLPGAIFCMVFFLCLLPGEQPDASSGARNVARKVSLDKKVLFFNTAHGERIFTVGWIDGAGQLQEKRHVSRKGFHGYEMRDHKGWSGEAETVSVGGIKVDSERVDFPNLSEEMDIFLAYEPWLRSSVNALWGHTLFGFSWDRVVLLVGFLITVAIYVVKKSSISLTTALLSGFVFLMILVEIRTTYGHIRMAEKLKENESIAQARGLAVFSRQLAGRIGEKHWSSEKLPSIASITIAYALAGKRFAPPSLKDTPQYVISYQNGGIVLIPPVR